jgi:glycosyltransferase involved in cell wall biosynthesis
VVATDCQSGPREVLEDGRLGRLVPPRDPAALAAAIEDALDRGNPPVAEASLARYSRDAVVARYLEIIEAA